MIQADKSQSFDNRRGLQDHGLMAVTDGGESCESELQVLAHQRRATGVRFSKSAHLIKSLAIHLIYTTISQKNELRSKRECDE